MFSALSPVMWRDRPSASERGLGRPVSGDVGVLRWLSGLFKARRPIAVEEVVVACNEDRLATARWAC
jgi:hypothetical protein